MSVSITLEEYLRLVEDSLIQNAGLSYDRAKELLQIESSEIQKAWESEKPAEDLAEEIASRH